MVCRNRAPRAAFLLLAILHLLTCASLYGAARADEVPVAPPQQRNEPMRVHVVEDTRPGCAPSCGRWIAMEGRIERGTAALFTHVLHRLGPQHLPIFIDSGGGSVADAMAIGKAIRARHLDVVVTETVFDACAAGSSCSAAKRGDVRGGRPNAAGSICASACVLILAAGERRGAAPWTGVGVHRMVSKLTIFRTQRLFRVLTRMVGGTRVEIDRQLVDERRFEVAHRTVAAAQGRYDEVGAYLGRMGIKPTLLSLMEATPSSEIHLLTRDEAATTAIVTDASDGEFLLRAEGKAPTEHAATVAAPGSAYVLRPGSGTKPQEQARVFWSLVRLPPGNMGGRAALRAEVATATLAVTLQLAPVSGRDKDDIEADVSFKLTNSANQSIERVLPLYKRAFATLARADVSRPFQPLVSTLFRTVLIPDVDISSPLPSGERAWLGVRGVTNGGRIVEVVFEIPPSSLLEDARTAWNVKTSAIDLTGGPRTAQSARP